MAAIWGGSWVLGRVVSAAGVPPLHGAMLRFLFGSAALLAIMLGRAWPRPDRRSWIKLAGMGFFGVALYNLCFFTGLQTVPPGRASLMASLQPSVVFAVTALFWNEAVTARKITGLVVSLAGAALVLSQGDFSRLVAQGLNRGDIWILGCMFSWVAYTLLGRSLGGTLPALASTAYSTWLGTVMLGVANLASPATASPEALGARVWMASGFLGIFGTALAFLMFLQSVNQIGPARASIFINLVPVFGVTFSALFLGEMTGLATLAGGAIVIAGVYMLNR